MVSKRVEKEGVEVTKKKDPVLSEGFGYYVSEKSSFKDPTPKIMCQPCRGRMIEILRKTKRLSQTELGQMLKISHAAISDIERGKTDMSIKKLEKLANALGLKPGELL